MEEIFPSKNNHNCFCMNKLSKLVSVESFCVSNRGILEIFPFDTVKIAVNNDMLDFLN